MGGFSTFAAGPYGSALKGVGGLLAGLFGDPTQTVNSNQSTNQSGEQQGNFNNFSNTDFTSWLTNLLHGQQSSTGATSTNINLDPSTRALLEKLTGRYSNNSQPFNSQAYQSGQIQRINQNADVQSQAVQQMMAANGVQGPAAAAAQTGVDNTRFANINQMQMQLPFTQQQFDLNNLASAASFFNMIPHGTTTTSQQTGTNDQSSNQSGNTTNNVSSGGTTYQSNQNASNTRGTSTSQKGGGLGAGLAGLVGGLFG